MNICILSKQRINNMGSLLQAYALKNMLEGFGHHVYFLDIERRDADDALLDGKRLNFIDEQEGRGFVAKFKKIDRYAFNRFKIKRQSIIQNDIFEEFRQHALEIDRHLPHYDLCVIGSDEVFSCLDNGDWGFTSQLFGDIPESDKVITYAASCGSTTFNELPNTVVERIEEAFRNVASFSVRDDNSHRFVSHFTDKEIVDNLDPVLIYSFDREIADVVLPALPERYCVIYSYYNRIHTDYEIDEILRFCNQNNLTPVAIGAPQYWIKDYVICSPFQCLKVFQNSSFVIADTFHGTIFSAKYASRFAVLSRPSNRNKLLDLVKRIGIDQHLMNDIHEVNRCYTIHKDTAAIDNLIHQELARSRQYLIHNL